MHERCAAAMLAVLLLVGCGRPDAAQPTTAPTPPGASASADGISDTQELMEQAQQALQQKNLERALELVEQAVAVDQQDPQKQLVLVQLAQMRGGKLAASDRKAANDCFRKAASAARSYRELKKTPLNEMDLQGLSVVFYKEACAFASDNQPDKAMAALREAVDAGFSNVGFLRTDQDLESLRARPDFQKLLADARQRMQEQMQAEVRGEMAANQPFDFSFALPDLQGKTVTLDGYKGKIVIVDIWGTWCPPCRMEVPHFIELYDKYRAQGLEIVGINYEEGTREEWSKTITEFVKEQRINYPCLIGDDATQARIANFRGFPTTLFVDRDGVVRLMLVGYHPYEKLEAAALELLAKPADQT